MDGTVFALSDFLCCIESLQQATQSMNHRLTADSLAVASKKHGFCNRYFANPTPGKAYGTHWLTR